ncbi:MAG: hypothetical protein CNLJKLNK_00707 [Holosporales bacterium]
MQLYCERGTELYLFDLKDEGPPPHFIAEEQTLFLAMSEKRKREYAASRGYLKFLIAQKTHQAAEDIILQKTSAGKLFYPSLFFNISHSQENILIGFSNQDIGVDIEDTTKKRAWQKIADHFFSKEECAWIKGDVLRFYHLWTLKEARYKCAPTMPPRDPSKKFETFMFENDIPILPNYTLFNGMHKNALYGWCIAAI